MGTSNSSREGLWQGSAVVVGAFGPTGRNPMVWVDRATRGERLLPGGFVAWAEVNKLADILM